MGNIASMLGFNRVRTKMLDHRSMIKKKRFMDCMSPLFQEINLPEIDASSLYDLFIQLDTEKVGVVPYTNFLIHFGIEGTKMVEAVFFKFNFQNGFTFPNFIVVMYFFCIATEKALGKSTDEKSFTWQTISNSHVLLE